MRKYIGCFSLRAANSARTGGAGKFEILRQRKLLSISSDLGLNGWRMAYVYAAKESNGSVARHITLPQKHNRHDVMAPSLLVSPIFPKQISCHHVPSRYNILYNLALGRTTAVGDVAGIISVRL